jgi:hypothetical protein
VLRGRLAPYNELGTLAARIEHSMTLSATDWLTVALVVITGVYAWVTFKILRANEAVVQAMNQQTEAQTRPYVVVSASPRIGTTLLLLEIQNTGKSPAVALRLTMDRDFYPHAERRESENIAKLPAFTEPIESLAPGARLAFILGVVGTIFGTKADESLCPRVFSVHAAYSHASHAYSENSTIDLRPMLHSSVLHDPVAAELERLRQSLEKVLKK